MVGETKGNSTDSVGRLTTALLTCGILSSLLYVGLNIFIPLLWRSYDSVSQTVSELSAVDAPTRQVWNWFAGLYTLFTIAFGWGVWRLAARNKYQRIAGALLFAYGIANIVWPFAPMHQREVLAAGGGTITDTIHLALATTAVILMTAAISFGAASFGKAFRSYSVFTILVLLVFGLLTAVDAPKVGANLPTPLAGVWERINIGVFMLWVIVLAVNFLKGTKLTDHQ